MTDDLIGIESRRCQFSGKGTVFNRKSCAKVYEWDDEDKYAGQMFVGVQGGKRELFVKFDEAAEDYKHESVSKVFKISKHGEDEKVWEDIANCPCGDKGRPPFPQVIQVSDQTLARYCYNCRCGSVQNVGSTDEDKKIFHFNGAEGGKASFEHIESSGHQEQLPWSGGFMTTQTSEEYQFKTSKVGRQS